MTFIQCSALAYLILSLTYCFCLIISESSEKRDRDIMDYSAAAFGAAMWPIAVVIMITSIIVSFFIWIFRKRTEEKNP